MQLTLNRAHPLCQTSRNLVFACFGTGLGGQVLDLSDRPSHGVARSDFAVPQVHRSLQSTVPPGFPADYQALTFRNGSTSFSGVEFGNVSKVTSLTTTFTAAMWVRPHDITSSVTIPLSTGALAQSGWIIGTSFLTNELWPDNAWGVSLSDPRENSRLADTALLARQWNLVAFTFVQNGSPRVKLYTNGVRSGTSYAPDFYNVTAGDRLTIGTYTNSVGDKSPSRCDVGPVLIWGTVLSDDDIALLYRDTWGMVTRGSNLLRTASTGATTTTTSSTTTLCYQGRTRFGLFSYLPGCGAIQWRNSRFKRSQ